MRVVHNLIVSILVWKTKRRREYLFKRWIQIESIKEQIVSAVETDRDDFPDKVLELISTATGVSFKWYEKADWLRVVSLFYVCLSKSPIIHLPLLEPSGKESEPEPWDYEGRTWHSYSHIIAKAYGWTLKEISQLKVGDALAKIQEILTDEQLELEFHHHLSEISWQYDKNTKKSVYQPLDRPHWMRPKAKPIPRFKIPVSMMPMGNVEVDGVLSEEYQPKPIT